MLDIVQVESETQLQQVRDLLHDYITWDIEATRSLGIDPAVLVDLHYNSVETQLPGEFVPPDGRLLLALYGRQAVGCGALRRYDANVCEVKRMYVPPAFRGKRIGKGLLQNLIDAARDIGYAYARLETTTFMHEAQMVYASLGFHIIAPYYELPAALRPITVFMECDLWAG